MVNLSMIKIHHLLVSALIILSSCEKSNHTNQMIIDEYTIEMLQNGYKSGAFTVTDVVERYLEMIKELDKNGPKLNSMVCINPDAIKIAQDLDKKLLEDPAIGPMYGIPVVLKDNIDTRDRMPTTAGSRILRNSYPKQDSWVAKKLREAGAVIIGKANLSEWANYRASYSSSGWSGIVGQTKNPYVLDRNPCGSSSGSAVAVSANLCALAIGTETWGSIMCPSNANGVVGIKPTVGLWSRSGIVPISYTQDTAGPMARTVTDAVKVLGALTGVDSSDMKTINSKGRSYSDYTQFLQKDGLSGKRIGYLTTETGKNFMVDSLTNLAIKQLQSEGAKIIKLDNIVAPGASKFCETVLAYEFKDGVNKYLSQLDESVQIKNLEDVISATTGDSIEMRYFNLKRLENAQQKSTLEDEEYKQALEAMLSAFRENGIDKVMDQNNLDAIVSPTGSPAWKTDLINGDNYHLSTSVYAALSGYPNISVPMGFVDDLPVGLSFYGRAWSEPVLIELAFAYEQSTGHRAKPSFLNSDGI